jgi:glycosyltransferase involved in cell wall biosynthesis
MSISVLILTLNEEENLPACLESVNWSDEVTVLDSYSTDRTLEIAEQAGARVVRRRFDNWATHQNWAMETIQYKNDWVFYLDADERMTSELHLEIEAIATDPNERRVAFYCGRKNFFMQRWIRHCYPPGMIMRFFRPPKVRFERLVNPTPIIHGPHGYLKNYFIHYNFSKGLSEWIEKHNRYSQLEAEEGTKLLKGMASQSPLLWSSDRASRRKALKILSFRLPFRPLLKFLYLFVYKRGLLDGYPGYVYCRLQTMYEYLIVLKMKEIQLRAKGNRL